MIIHKEGGDPMEGQARVNAFLDPDLKKRLYRVLLEEDTNFSDWLRGQIVAYLEKKEPKGKPRKGKEG
jgi:hypothetical protein